jgi:uncharacterized ion transporter superfamily protein YfcC
VFLAGGGLTVVEATGAIGNTLDVAMLALGDVPYGRWLRFIAVPLLILVALSAAAMAVGARIGI